MYVKMKPTSSIKKRLGVEPKGAAQSFLTNTCYKHMTKYVPMYEGNLRINVDIKSNSITYESPYASYQYYGMRKDGSHVVRNYTTAGTGPYWNKRMWSAEQDDIMEEMEKFIKRGGN